MAERVFFVQGSASEPYRVRFVWDEAGRFASTCTCAAASQGSHCKHRLGVILRERAVVAALDPAAVDEVVFAASASAIGDRLVELAQAERAAVIAKDQVAMARRRLSEALLGR